jgi:two-component system, NtrC family, sensor histidine kinase HydH
MPAEARQRFVSIRAKLLAASGILLVASTLLYGYVAFTTARSALLPSIREQLADDAVNVKGGLEEMLTAHYRNVHSWSRLALMRELVVRDMDKTVARFLATLKADYAVYLDVVAIDRDGTCIASSNPADIGTSMAGTPLAGAGDQADDTTPTLEWSEQHHAWYIRLASPIPDPDHPGQVLGTLVAMLDREVLDRIVVSKPGHSQVELRLLDGADRLVAGRRTAERIEHIETWKVGRGENPDHFPADAPPLLHEGKDSEGRAFVVAQVPIGNGGTLPTPGWHLTASAPKELALAPVSAVRDRVFATGFGLVLFGLLAIALLADRLARPIKELTEVAARIARTGDLEPVPSPRSHDEVGELAAAFQRMVTAVATANDEMIRASKLAFLGEMAAGMAHEIRTPLGIIRNSAQLIERRMETGGDPEAAEWALFIREESDRLARVVTDLLDFVKPVPPMKSDTDLAGVAHRAAHLLASEAANRDVALLVDDDSTAGPVACDADQIHQVCLNLIMNALQASTRGGEVRVSVSRSDGHAELAVRDRGRGLPPEIADRLFEPFTSQRDGGIGLGLAIVRRIVRAHGGDVVARNRAGGGAEFIVTLPLARQAPAEVNHET